MKIALVYDRINKFGGAERVLLALNEIWPDAVLYTAVYNPETAPWASRFTIIPSFLQSFPLAKRQHEFYPWLTPIAFESFNFSGYDLVISVTSAEAKGIITKPGTIHICYCLTPTRYLWSDFSLYRSHPSMGLLSPLASLVLPVFAVPLRRWDYIAANRCDKIVSISKTVATRVKKYYHRQTTVIYPPVDTEVFNISKESSKKGEFFLVVSRLVPYKRVDIVIRAFNQLGWPLVIVGSGHQEQFLKRIAKKNISFVSNVTDKEMVNYYQRCKALVFAGVEDFGITSLEAQACGRPVIAYNKGGYTETIIEGVTGEFFNQQTEESLISRLQSFDERKYKPELCRSQALRFSKERFKKKFKRFINKFII